MLNFPSLFLTTIFNIKHLVSHAWHENEDPNSRRFSVESEDQGALPLGLRKLSKKRSRMGSDSHFGSLGSNLNQISQVVLQKVPSEGS